jgi:hypothetical protein
MLNILIYVLAFIIGFTLTLGIIGGVLWLLQKRSSNLFKITGSFYIRNNLHTGINSYNNYNSLCLKSLVILRV